VDTPATGWPRNYSGGQRPKGSSRAPTQKIARAVVRCAESPVPRCSWVLREGAQARARDLTADRRARHGADHRARFLAPGAGGASPANLHEPSPRVGRNGRRFNREAGAGAALRARRTAAAGASVLGPGILTWLLLRGGDLRRRG
jgi:hypothetical protein